MHINIITPSGQNVLGANAQLWQIRLHSKIANELLNNGWQQNQVANILGTTQSTVSRWKDRSLIELSSEDDNFEIDKLASIISSNLSKNGVPDNISLEIKIGKEFSKINLEIVKEGYNSINNILINSMSRIINEFSKLPKMLIPAVGINIATCSKDVKNISEVIAFPGRLRAHEGNILQQVLPQIGASKHLAEVLLSLRSKESNSNAIINLKLPSMIIIKKLSEKLNLEICNAPRGISEKNGEILIDNGDFGWEPSLYIAANGVNKMPKIVNELIIICKEN